MSGLNARTKIGISLTALAGATVLGVLLCPAETLFGMDKPELGDFIGGFAGAVALVWIIVAYYGQSEELQQNNEMLRLQKEELRLTREELSRTRDEVKKQAEEAKRMADIQAEQLKVTQAMHAQQVRMWEAEQERSENEQEPKLIWSGSPENRRKIRFRNAGGPMFEISSAGCDAVKFNVSALQCLKDETLSISFGDDIPPYPFDVTLAYTDPQKCRKLLTLSVESESFARQKACRQA